MITIKIYKNDEILAMVSTPTKAQAEVIVADWIANKGANTSTQSGEDEVVTSDSTDSDLSDDEDSADSFAE